MAKATVKLLGPNYAVEATMRHHRLVGDEPVAGGGQDAGPAPYDLLLASLGACTAITLKMYADRKGWPLTDAEVALEHHFVEGRSVITRTLDLTGGLDEDQRARLADIAERTPVTLTLKNGADITTRLAPDARRVRVESELDEELDETFPASDPLDVTRRGSEPD